MVPPIYQNGSNVLPFALSTSVLRIWAAQPIGRKRLGWQSYGVKRTMLRGVGVGNATRVLRNREHEASRNALEVL
jgi:hypothetical protein